MRLTRCFVPEALQSGAIVTLPPAAGTHVLRVLRLRAGAPLTLFDGRGGEYAAELLDGARDAVRVRVGERREIEREAPVRVTLLQCLARAERMDWIVQKATELGVAHIVPVASAHSLVQVQAGAAARRLSHWQAVAISACEQCGRNRLPQLQPICGLERACREADDDSLRLLLHPEAPLSLAGVLTGERLAPQHQAPHPPVCLLVGPEGGLAGQERQLAEHHGFRACRLGPRTLRAETAPLAALAAIQALVGDFI